MNFTEATKRDAEEKFQQLDAGTAPSPITPPELDSFSQFEQKSKKFHDRIASQDMEVKRAFDTITANKNNRLAAEAAERKRIADAEAAEKRKAEAAEKARLAEIKRKEDEERYRRWKREDRIKKIVIISLIAIGAIFGIRAIVKGAEAKEYARYSGDNIVITIEDKVEATKNSSYFDGYITAFKVKIKNKSILDVSEIKGEMKVYNASDKLLINSICTFTGDMTAGEESTFTLNIDNRKSDEVVEFYYADCDDLKVTFKLTEVTYGDNETREYSEEPVTILTLSVGSDGISTTEKTYQEALSLYNQGKHAEALPKFEALGYYKESMNYYSDCLEKVEEAETESAYQSAITLMNNEKYAEAIATFVELYYYKDSKAKVQEVVEAGLAKAEALADVGDYEGAYNIASQLDNGVYWTGVSSAKNRYSYAKDYDYASAVYYGLKKVIIAEGIEEIPSNYFAELAVETVVLPTTIKLLNTAAFKNCKSLKSINLPEGLLIINDQAFMGCSSLEITKLPSTLTKIGDSAFRNCSGLRGDIVIGNSVESIGSKAFASCEMASVKLGSSVTSIGDSAFESCCNMTSITIPASVSGIGSGAFSYCYKLVEVVNNSSLMLETGSGQNGGIAQYAIEVHSGSSKLVKTDGYIFYTFEGNNYLVGYEGTSTSLMLPTRYNNGTYVIHDYAFYNQNSIISVAISDCVTKIGDKAFNHCDNLESVSIGNSVTNIGYGAFESCRKMSNLTIGSSVAKIEGDAFRYCKSLTSLRIPASVNRIEQYAFYDCSALKNVTFANTSNWYAARSSSSTGGTALSNLANTSNAASNLTSHYASYYWNHKQS